MTPSQELSDPEQEEHYWLPIADLMTGLMILFLFISLTYMVKTGAPGKGFVEKKQDLYIALVKEFGDSLPIWGAEIDSASLSIRFKDHDVLFTEGSAEVRPAFRAILGSFFPRYAKIVREHSAVVDEIRIEGHTSSEGPGKNPYYYNMKLSQDRTRAVLAYCLESTDLDGGIKAWVQSRLTANGLSSSKLVRNNNIEDRAASRRVEFRVRTNADSLVASINTTSR